MEDRKMGKWADHPDIIGDIPWRNYVDRDLGIFKGKDDRECFDALFNYKISPNRVTAVIMSGFWDHMRSRIAELKVDNSGIREQARELKLICEKLEERIDIIEQLNHNNDKKGPFAKTLD